jgi:modulator of FtsH protease HflK
MPWNNQGGGWQGGGGQGPWGGRPDGGGGPQPPDLEELLRRGQERVKRMFPGGGFGGGGSFLGNKKVIAFVGLIAVAVWLASGFYRVQPDEQGVVLMFGKLSRVTGPGLN